MNIHEGLMGKGLDHILLEVYIFWYGQSLRPDIMCVV